MLQFDDSTIAKNIAVATEYFKAYYPIAYREKKFSGGTTGFIPFNIEFTIDGLSGIKIYNKLRIDTSFLPNGYPLTLDFIVTGVEHKLKDGDWETLIKVTLIPKLESTEVVVTTANFKASIYPTPPAKVAPAVITDETLANPSPTPERDAWILLAIVLREGGGDKQSVVDVAQSIANRAGSKSYGGVTNGSIYSLVTSFNQYQPAFKDGNGNVSNEWLNVKDFTTAKIAANYKYEESDKRKFQDSVKGNKYNTFDEWIGAQLKAIWLNLIDQNLRANAASFIQGRTDFKSTERFGGSRAGASTIISNANSKAKKLKSNNNVWRGTSDHNVFGWQYYYITNTTYPLPSIADLMKLKPIFDNVIIKP
jgi:hypothetical protein